jgi:hypothetical protein
MKCDEDATVAGTIAVLATKVPQRGFKEAIAEVQKAGRPLTLDISEGAMTKLGGAGKLGERIAQDLMDMRGENLPEELAAFHDKDYKTIKTLYEALIRLSKDRDAMVGEQGDPLDGVSEEDLMAIASQAAMLRIEVDTEFRRQLLAELVELDPDVVLEYAALALDKLDDRATVEVIDDGST